MIITGIPRSGTSLLCRLLHDAPNWVVINEPGEIFGPLTRCENPWWIGTYYRELRHRVLAGESVENKIVDGRLVEDTWENDARTTYRPTVSSRNFALGTKNTLAYLARLRVIASAMPEAAILVCIRNPLDTIASWKRTFGHLRDVNFESFPLSYKNSEFLDGTERRRIDEIESTADPAVRRALLWAHLARTVIGFEGMLTIVRYEDMTTNPERELGRIASRVGVPVPLAAGSELSARQHREHLSPEDEIAVRDICGSLAERFGYFI